MALVRMYQVDSQGHIHQPAREIDCDDDAAAVARARTMIAETPVGWSIEIWDRARRVAILPVPGATDALQTATMACGASGASQPMAAE